jgi:hypothetical protein
MITMTIETPSIPESLKNPKGIIREEINRALSESVLTLRNALMESTPTDTGTLKNAWLTRQPAVHGNEIEASVGNSQPYILTIEQGTKPFMPPAGAMIGWVQRHVTNITMKESVESHRAAMIAAHYATGDLSKKALSKTMRRIKDYNKTMVNIKKGEAQDIAFLIAKSIQGRGLPSSRNTGRLGEFSRTLSRTTGAINQFFNNAMERITSRFAGSSV